MSHRPRRRGLWIGAALFALALALYARTGSFPFIEYDDPPYVRNNPHIAGGLDGTSLRWALTSVDYQYNWHPLTWLSHALDVSLFNLDAGKHHLVNVLLHALNAALVFAALRSLGLRDAVAGLVAASFAVHPMRVESVAWISERKDLLAGAGFLCALLAWGRYAWRPSAGRYGLVVLAMALGLMAKPTLVTLPFLLLVLDVWPLRRWSASPFRTTPSLAPTRPEKTCAPRPGHLLLLEKVPLLLLAGAAIALTWIAQSGGGAVNTRLALGERLLHAPVAALTYLRQLVAPLALSVFYPHPALVGDGTPLALGLGALGALAVLVGLAVRVVPRSPWFAVGLAWFLGTLVPMIGLVQVGEQSHADRYAYLSFLGLELAVACALVTWSDVSAGRRRAATALVLVAIGVLTAASARRIGDWSSSRRLFESALALDPRNYVAHNVLGQLDGLEDALDGALEHFEAARAAFPDFFAAQINVGKARYRRKEIERARAAFAEAVRVRPESAEARLYHGITLAATGRFSDADGELDQAVALDPAIAQDPNFQQTRAALDHRLEEAPR